MYDNQDKDLPEIIRQAQQQKPKAFEALLEKIDSKLNGFIHYFMHEIVEERAVKDEDARDIKQEVHIKLARLMKGTGYKEEGKFWGLLFTITSNCVTDFYKHNHTLVYDNELADATEDIPGEQDKESDEREQQHLVLMHIVNRLPLQQKTIWQLHMQEEMKFKEIGNLLQIEEATARSQFRYAKEKVVEELKQYRDDEEKKKRDKKVEKPLHEMKAHVVTTGIRATK